MDGNGRWARQRGLPRLAGHKQGVEAVRKIVEACPDLGIEWLTLFAFSTENWKRSDDEVSGLMTMFRSYMAREAERLLSEDVRLRFIGRRSDMPSDLMAMMEDLEARSSGDHKFNLNIAINHGGRDEITRATRSIAAQVASGVLSAGDITEDVMAAHMDTAGIPDPCLVVRTSGESRISNFLLWEAAYSEYEFVDTYWPDFTPDMLGAIIDRFGQRERRYGAAIG
jgi:undecaprenyl diphosphate synthase